MPICSTVRSTIMSAGCARKSSRTQKIRAILRRFGEADTSSRWIRNWLRSVGASRSDQKWFRRRKPERPRHRDMMRLRFWPNTLSLQLILVTATAVALSNIAVAFWFEYGNEQQTATAANERVLDRAASVATTM